MDTSNVYKEDYFLSAGEVNAEGILSVPMLTSRIIDIATAHANSLGIGNPDMLELKAGWVLSRLTIEMFRYPAVNTSYSVSTWITAWNRHFSERCFCIADAEGNVMGYARSIWMVISTETHENVGLSHLNLPGGMVSDRECPIKRQAKHRQIVAIDDSASSPELLRSTHPDTHYTFKYCDLDYYRHVNTVRYVVLLLNQLPLDLYDRETVRRLELSFLNEARYGMDVVVRRSQTEAGDNAFSLTDSENGKAILFARLGFSGAL